MNWLGGNLHRNPKRIPPYSTGKNLVYFLQTSPQKKSVDKHRISTVVNIVSKTREVNEN